MTITILQETIAALIGVGEDPGASLESQNVEESLDGIPIFDDRPIDFSGGAGLDGEPMVCVTSNINNTIIHNKLLGKLGW